MTPINAFFMASLAGALLFFSAGLLYARRQPSATAARSSQLDAPQPEVHALHTQLHQSQQLLSEMRKERERLIARLARAHNHQGDQQPPLSNVNVRFDVMRRKVVEADEIANENSRLKRTIEQLEAELSNLRSDRLVATSAAIAPATRSPRSGAEGSTQSALDKLLTRLTTHRGIEAAVLADELGLPVAGAGDHTTALAALSGYLDDATTKATEYLPITTIQRVSIHDVSSRIITMSSLVVGDSRIVLLALSNKVTPSAAIMAKTLDDAARLI